MTVAAVEREHLPQPTWQGFGDDLLQKFATYTLTSRIATAKEEPERIARELEDAVGGAERYERMLTELRESVRKYEAEIAQLEEVMRAGEDDTALLAELERLNALPFVIGTRTDMTGRLYIQLRLTPRRGMRRRDLGDFEIGLVHDRRNQSSYRLHQIRRVEGMHYDKFHSFEVYDRQGDCVVGSIGLTAGLIANRQLVQLAQEAHDSLIGSAREPYGGFPLLGNPEQIWDGFTANPMKAVKRSIALLKESSPEERVRRLSNAVGQSTADIERYMQLIREQRAKVRQLRAAHQDALRLADGAALNLDLQEVLASLQYIMQLPGLVGIKFDDEGVPILHVRSSHLIQGRRFDFGDYQFRLVPNRYSHQGVIETTRTRGERGYYWHPDGYHGEGWFCFGNREAELRNLLKSGSYREFVHLLINTLNSVNERDRSLGGLMDVYREIPVGEVWQNRLKKRRQRPRRQPRRPRELGRVAIDQAQAG